MRVPLGNIRTGFEGFRRLLDLEDTALRVSGDQCIIDMSQLQWLDANMCSILGAICHRVLSRGVQLDIEGLSGWTENTVRKNGFLSDFGRPTSIDWHDTTIKYRRFLEDPPGEFKSYVDSHFRAGSLGLPQMSEALLRRFRSSLFELLWNALEHSETEMGIFACGQYYPRKNRLDFTISDLGIGMRERIRRSLKMDLSPCEAIDWAMSGNTTKRGRVPGGLGLKLIREFITLNGGRIIVASDAGYWQFSGGEKSVQPFDKTFSGTVVTIEINTADQTSYRLKSEVDPADIF